MYFIYSEETASSNIAGALRPLLDMQKAEDFNGLVHFTDGTNHMVEVKGRLIDSDSLEGATNGLMIFLSRHSSTKGIPAFTVHAEGNWSNEALLGGKPKSLGVASPVGMLNALSSISSLNTVGITVTYEATHHGPFLNNPYFFAELGGNEETIGSKRHAELLAEAIEKSLDADVSYDKIAIGIGGMHYSEKFTRLAIEGRYAFGHIMPKYHIGQVDMLGKAIARSDMPTEVAVIEWKSIKAVEREMIVRELNVLGIDYAKV